MNRKTIKTVLTKKLNDWISSIDDELVKAMVEKNTIVTGGCFASMLLNEDVKDFDIYFKDLETTKAVANYYIKKFNERNNASVQFIVEEGQVTIRSTAGYRAAAQDKSLTNLTDEPFEDVYDKLPEDTSNKKYFPLFLSSNAITLTNQIQLIIRFYGSADEIHSNFDFVHCMNYYDLGTGEVVLRPESVESLINKELVYRGSKYPLCSIIRTRKYIKRGFHINAGQYLKMCFQLSLLDLTDINVLRDQCVGVDSAYFMALIDGLQSKMESDSSFLITNDYICAIIDRIF